MIATRRRRALRLLAILTVPALLGVGLALAAALVMTAPFNHDEHMYLTAAHLLDEYDLYRDYAYLQAPYMPYVYRLAFVFTADDHLLLAGRLTKVAVVWALILVVFQLCRRISGDTWLAVGCALLLVNSNLLRHTIGTVRNYDLAMLLVLLALWAAFWISEPRYRRWALLIAGFCLGLAIGVKTIVALAPLCFVPLLVRRGIPWRQSVTDALILIAGIVVALLPAATIALSAGVDVAGFNNFGYHHLNEAWRSAQGLDAQSLADKTNKALPLVFATPSLVTLFIGALLLGLQMWRRPRYLGELSPARQALVLLVPMTLVTAFIPSPMQPNYFSAVGVATTLVVAVFFAGQTPRAAFWTRALLGVAVVLLVFVHNRNEVPRVGALFAPERWTAMQVHERALAARSAIPPEQRQRPVATLAPLYALEAGLPIYRELATGPFAYRIGHLLDDESRRRYHTTSPGSLGDLLETDPPAAIIVVQEEKGLEEAFIDEARKYGAPQGIDLGGRVAVHPCPPSGRSSAPDR